MQVESLYLRQSRPTVEAVELSHSSMDLTLEPTQDENIYFFFSHTRM